MLANSMDPDQTAPVVWMTSLISVYTICFLIISADDKKQMTFVLIGAFRVKIIHCYHKSIISYCLVVEDQTKSIML